MNGGLHDQVVDIIIERLNEIGMTQTELGRRIGWTPKHVNRILHGHAEPSMAALDFICHILGITLTLHATKE